MIEGIGRRPRYLGTVLEAAAAGWLVGMRRSDVLARAVDGRQWYLALAVVWTVAMGVLVVLLHRLIEGAWW